MLINPFLLLNLLSVIEVQYNTVKTLNLVFVITFIGLTNVANNTISVKFLKLYIESVLELNTVNKVVIFL